MNTEKEIKQINIQFNITERESYSNFKIEDNINIKDLKLDTEDTYILFYFDKDNVLQFHYVNKDINTDDFEFAFMIEANKLKDIEDVTDYIKYRVNLVIDNLEGNV